jgi:REP element-mobilizing transposase RayT
MVSAAYCSRHRVAAIHDHGSKMNLHVVVVMPDHVHLVLTPLCCETGVPYSFEEILGGIKGASAHSVNKALRRSGTVWQDESFDHVVRCQESLEEKILYVCLNPVRKGLVARPEDYKWLWKSCTAEAAVPHGWSDASSLEEKILYVCLNPVRKGLVAKPEDYKWLWKSCTAEAAVPHGWSDASSLEEKILYVCLNPVRKGLVGKPEDYKWLWKSCTAEAAVPHGWCQESLEEKN